MKQKKIIIGSVVGVLILVLAGVSFWQYSKSQVVAEDESAPTKRRIVEPENIIPVNERPVIAVKPEADGRNVTITVSEVKKAATEAEYMLEYQTGTLVQAQQGLINLDTIPVNEKILLGSCSAGGACTYHTEVRGGSLRTRFADGNEAYALKSDWKYIENKDGESAFSSRDAFFQIDSPDLADQPYLIIFNGSGYPTGLESFGVPVSDPYHLAVSGRLEGEGTITLRAREEGSTKLLGWDGSEWIELEATAEGKSLTAEGPLLPLYIAVQ